MGIKEMLGVSVSNERPEKVTPQKIVKDREFLSKKCVAATFAEAEEIWPVLTASLGNKGWGLAANQIGIQKSVGFIKFKNKTYKLLNPRIVESSTETIVFTGEGCLSFPGKTCNTLRFVRIIVEDDNLGRLDLSLEKDDLLPIIFQHEIDHLNGSLIFDLVRNPITRVEKKVGRNAPCSCGSGKKFKKCCG